MKTPLIRNSFVFALVLSVLTVASTWFSKIAVAEQPTVRDLPYATADSRSLCLDLYQPSQPEGASPLIIWIHGGAWRSGSKSDVPIVGLLKHGYAIASVEYRLSPEAPFPAQVHDIQAAIRVLRSRAAEYSLDPQRFFIAGASAGGHLAALVGVSVRVRRLQGHPEIAPGESSAVAGIVSFYGASNLQTILGQSTPHGLSVRVPALRLLLGGSPEERPEVAALASPVTHVDASDPALLLIHGDQDPQMPVEQAYEFARVYRQAELPVKVRIVAGGVHGGESFYAAEMLKEVADFLASTVQNKATQP
jgi:acetyl esterase/lipase